MPNSQKPVITPQHHERFAQIMQTPTRPNAPKISDSAQPSKVSALLASLPKPKGIGNKMFVFTGKKKIILEAGGKQEVEQVKTVDAPALKTDAKEEHAKPEETSKTPSSPKTQDTKEKKEGAKKGGGAKAFLVIALIVFLGAWALFWLYFLDFI